mmetsp:Transcript_28672/g.72563  ORF Transcript_28672/g.72563 Transcript_28672/m.72563 type:complete len:84 (-) Transcript_28672:1153-1404(-)
MSTPTPLRLASTSGGPGEDDVALLAAEAYGEEAADGEVALQGPSDARERELRHGVARAPRPGLLRGDSAGSNAPACLPTSGVA